MNSDAYSNETATDHRNQSSSLGTERKVVICAYLPMNAGAGVERFVLLLSNALKRAGIPHDVVDIDAAGIRRKTMRRFRYYCAFRVGIATRKRVHKEDLVVCNNFFSWNTPKKGFIVFHGTDIGRVKAAGKDMSFARRLIVQTVGEFLEKKTADGRTIVAVSQAAKDEIESLYHLKVSKVIPNAVDLSKFCPAGDRSLLRKKLGLPTDKFLILFVGTRDPRKGLNWILEELRPNLDASQELVLRVDFDEAPRGVRALTRMSMEKLADLYRSCDVLLFPTNYEGCSFGLAEALASGLPVITSPAGSGRDLLEREELRPYVIESRDWKAYLERIRRLQDSPDEWRRVSAACRAVAEKNHDLSKFENTYADLVKSMWKSE